MDDVRTAGSRAAVPSAALRAMMALAERIAARAARHTRLADAVVRARSPKLLRAATRISYLVPVGSPARVHHLAANSCTVLIGAGGGRSRWRRIAAVPLRRPRARTEHATAGRRDGPGRRAGSG